MAVYTTAFYPAASGRGIKNYNKLNMRLKITLQQAAGNALAIAGQTRHYALDSGFCHNISSHVGIMTLHDDTL
jgi:hypothetical protein